MVVLVWFWFWFKALPHSGFTKPMHSNAKEASKQNTRSAFILTQQPAPGISAITGLLVGPQLLRLAAPSLIPEGRPTLRLFVSFRFVSFKTLPPSGVAKTMCSNTKKASESYKAVRTPHTTASPRHCSHYRPLRGPPAAQAC